MPRANAQITANNVRLIDDKGEMIGVVSLQDAMTRAKSLGLDLVEIAPMSDPPVCKILDFSRYKYELKKQKQEVKKKQKRTFLKEMKFRTNIDIGDFNVKLNKIKKFLEAGDKVKVSLFFRGREIVHKEKGFELFKRILDELGESVKVDAAPKMEGKQIIMILQGNSVS